MRAPSQMKVSTISFLIALIFSILVFGIIAYFAISGFMSSDEEQPSDDKPDTEVTDPDNPVIDDPETTETINGQSFKVLVAGYDLLESGFDAMLVVDVNKESRKVSVYPINTDTKVYVGHGDTNSLNVRLGDLIKYKDIQYVLDKTNAVTGLKVEYYVTFTAKGFIDAFDAFNKSGDYTYKVPKDMDHIYAQDVTVLAGDEEKPLTAKQQEQQAFYDQYKQYNFSFKKGDSLTSGIDVYNMLRYKGDSASDRMSRQATFARDVMLKIIPSRFKEGKLSAIVDTAKSLLKLSKDINTNISAETFITESFDLISAIPDFSLGTVTKFTSGITNFK